MEHLCTDAFEGIKESHLIEKLEGASTESFIYWSLLIIYYLSVLAC